MTRIGIIGTGRLGTRLAEQIVLDGLADELVMANRTTAKLQGTILSLQVWVDVVGAKTKISRWSATSRDSVDAVIVAVKEKYDPRLLMGETDWPNWLPIELRYIGLLRDLHTLQEVGRLLAGYRGCVVVVTNPVDVVTTLIQRWLPDASVLGSGVTLDSARLSYVCARKRGSAAASCDLPLGGEHGGDLVPLPSLCSPGSNADDILRGEDIRTLLAESGEIGVEIVKRLGYTVQDCAVVVARDLAWILKRRGAGPVRCFSVIGCPPCERVAIGSPIRFVDGRAKTVLDELDTRERDGIGRAKERVALVVDGVLQDCPRLAAL